MATGPQVKSAVVCVAITAPLAGELLMAHAGTGTMAAVVKLVLFEISQSAAGPLAFLGMMYQLYSEPATKPAAL